MNKQFLEGAMPQYHGATMHRIVDNELERSRVEFCAREVGFIEDCELLLKTERFRKPGQTLLSFMGESGLGPRPLREWDLERIEKWLVQQALNAKDQEQEPKFYIGETRI